MIFGLGKKSRKDGKSETGETASDDDQEKRTEDDPPLQSTAALAADDLRRTVDADTLKLKTTDDLEPMHGLIGQERAVAGAAFRRRNAVLTTTISSSSVLMPRARAQPYTQP